MKGVASWFYKRVYNTFLECLMRIVWKSKKSIDNWNARASDRHQEEEKKHTHGEMLKGHFD
jgi:heme-degrading monooxygenase HmoA